MKPNFISVTFHDNDFTSEVNAGTISLMDWVKSGIVEVATEQQITRLLTEYAYAHYVASQIYLSRDVECGIKEYLTGIDVVFLPEAPTTTHHDVHYVIDVNMGTMWPLFY